MTEVESENEETFTDTHKSEGQGKHAPKPGLPPPGLDSENGSDFSDDDASDESCDTDGKGKGKGKGKGRRGQKSRPRSPGKIQREDAYEAC